MKWLSYVYILQMCFVPALIYQIIVNLILKDKVNPISIFALILLIWAIPRFNPIWNELKNKDKASKRCGVAAICETRGFGIRSCSSRGHNYLARRNESCSNWIGI